MSHKIVAFFNSVVTTFDLNTLVRLANNPSRCQAAVNAVLFYDHFEDEVFEVLDRMAECSGVRDVLQVLEKHTNLEVHSAEEWKNAAARVAIEQTIRDLLDDLPRVTENGDIKAGEQTSVPGAWRTNVLARRPELALIALIHFACKVGRHRSRIRKKSSSLHLPCLMCVDFLSPT